MEFFIVCTCGERIAVDAPGDDEAVDKLMPALEEHLSKRKKHPELMEGSMDEEKKSWIRSRMQKEP